MNEFAIASVYEAIAMNNLQLASAIGVSLLTSLITTSARAFQLYFESPDGETKVRISLDYPATDFPRSLTSHDGVVVDLNSSFSIYDSLSLYGYRTSYHFITQQIEGSWYFSQLDGTWDGYFTLGGMTLGLNCDLELFSCLGASGSMYAYAYSPELGDEYGMYTLYDGPLQLTEIIGAEPTPPVPSEPVPEPSGVLSLLVLGFWGLRGRKTVG